ncbi:MAG TPA: serine hydrolase domain-containing protein [Gemmatimonadales bacterium]|nr:serine hydrolase domain-containing protein [Gemmatimonadales bacterium]
MLFRPARSARPRPLLRRVVSVLVAVLTGATHPLTAQHAPVKELATAIQDGIRDRVFPGAVVLVGRSDTLLYAMGFGSYAWGVDTRRPDPAWTLWDVASLTKVVATMSAAALLYDHGRLDLESPVHRLVPRFAGDQKDSVTFSMLLDHTSGLPAWVRLSVAGADRSHALTTLFDVGLRRPPGTSALYSDLNAIIAALGIEQITGQPFERFTVDSVFRPTGMRNATWRPDAFQRLHTAPTQLLPDGSAILGSVNDANADVLGGVAGHAGVFATGMDLAHFAQTWLRAVRGRDSTWIHQATALRFLERSERSGTRALGWDTPRLLEDGVVSLYGRCATRTTWGHTGFTGTLIWFDPVADLFVVFLTNRSYDPVPQSMSDIRDVRTLVSDAARRLGGGSCR